MADAELKLTNQMLAAGGRYTDLKQSFRKFRQAARDAFHSNVRYAPLAVTLGEMIEGYKFSVELAGRVVWFVFSVRMDEADVGQGQVTVLMQRIDPAQPPLHLTRFTFSKGGETSLDDPDSEEKLNVFVPASAGYVLLTCLRLALKRDWE